MIGLSMVRVILNFGYLCGGLLSKFCNVSMICVINFMFLMILLIGLKYLIVMWIYKNSFFLFYFICKVFCSLNWMGCKVNINVFVF